MQTKLLEEKTEDVAVRKKIIIVNNNMKIGGIQKALLNLLHEISSEYDVTLFVLNNVGECLEKVPKNVTVVGCDSLYKYFGMSQAESKRSLHDYILRSLLAFTMRLGGRKFTTRIISAFSKKLKTEYDCAISYMHDGSNRLLYGGCNDFVLSKINAKKKITFLHCDYENFGGNYKSNNAVFEKFDVIAACSEGCRNAFLRVIPHLESKTKTVINCHNFAEITALSQENTVVYDNGYINAIIVARLNSEKGVERAIYALKHVLDKNLKVKLHIVGGGVLMNPLKELCKELCVEDSVVFYGEQTNPYRYIKNADFLFIPSFHEAAPLVIDEALCLGVPVMSTLTTSSEDMILKRNCGWVCENSQEAINRTLYEITADLNEIPRLKEKLSAREGANNRLALSMFEGIVE